MRISDWSSDVCSSDLPVFAQALGHQRQRLDDRLADIIGQRCRRRARATLGTVDLAEIRRFLGPFLQILEDFVDEQIGRASGRESVWPYVEVSVVPVSLTNKTKQHKSI